MTSIVDNSLFVFGDLECLYEFCFKRNTWTLVPWNGDAPTRRREYEGFLYRDHFYVFGGNDVSTYKPVENAFIQYEFATRTWRNVDLDSGSPPAPIHGFASAFYGSSLYCLRTSETESNRSSTKTWLLLTTTGQAPRPRASCVVHNDTWVVLVEQHRVCNGVYIFDFELRSCFSQQLGTSTIHELDVVGYPVHCGNGPSVLHGFVGGVYNNSLIVFEKRTPTSMVSCYKKLQLQHESIPAAPDSTVISERSSHCYLRSLVGNSTLSDITFIVEGIKIFGHVNLCARYTSFQDIFVVSFTFVITSGLVAINVGHPFTSVADTSNDHISTRLGWILRRPLFARDA
ncbi:hypothetical protein PI124_g16963 [Phytophthora idaei]|nr:hypothetical protein PI124_g16963 [Phytophthora idaei]